MTDTLDLPASSAVVVRESHAVGATLSVNQIVERLDFIKQVMATAMVEGQDYGKVPGCGDKPGLFQPGAQKLSMTFQLNPEVREEVITDYPNYHRGYRLVVRVTNGAKFADGVGECSTLESKYRYRNAGKKCPACGKETIIKGKAEYGGGWLCFAKKGGCGAKYSDGDKAIESQADGKAENENPADAWNTARKMAFKRAFVHAIINATNTSELWSQDLEDLASNGVVGTPEQAGGSQDTTKAKQTPPRANQSATTATIKPFKSKAVLIKLLERYRSAAARVLQARGVLTPAETLEDWDEEKLPRNADELNDLLAAVQKEADGDQPEGAEVFTPAIEVPPEQERQWWMDVEIPFGKQKGKKLSELGEKSLSWWCENYVLKPYNGQISDKARQFREALDAAAEYHTENA